MSSVPPPPPPSGPPPPGSPPPGYAPYGGGMGGPLRNSGKATGALVCGIVGLVFCTIILAPVALVLALQARKEIDASGGAITGRGMATAGMVLGIIGIVLIPINIIIYASLA